MTYQEVAEVLRLSESGVRKIIARRDLRNVDLGYKSKRVKRNDLEKYIEKKCK